MRAATPLLAALVLALAASPAASLSCRRPDMARSYQMAAKSAETYIVVLGTLEFDAALLPQGKDRPPEGRQIPARLQGRPVTPAGFSAWTDRSVTLNLQCVSAWCGSVASGEQMLMFLRRTGDSYTLDAGPCAAFHFPSPSASDLATLRACLSGGPCAPRR